MSKRPKLLLGQGVVAVPLSRPKKKALLLAMIIAVIDVFGLYSTLGRWWGWLPATIHAIQNFNHLADPIAACWAALVANGVRRWGLGEWGQTAVRGRTEQFSRVVLHVLIPVVVAHAAVALGAIVLTLHAGSPITGWVWAGGIIATGWLVSVMWIALGAALGIWLPIYVALGLALLIPYMVNAAGDIYPTSPIAFIGFSNSTNYLVARPQGATILVGLLVYLALIVIIFRFACRWRDRLASVAAVGLCVALVLAFSVGQPQTDIDGAEDSVCRGTEPTICLPHTYAAAEPGFRAMLQDAWPSIPESLRPRHIVGELVVQADGEQALVADPADSRDLPSLWPQRPATLGLFGAALLKPRAGCPPVTEVNELGVQLWWSRTMKIPIDGSGYPGQSDLASMPQFDAMNALAERLARMNLDERGAWLQANVGGWNSCASAN